MSERLGTEKTDQLVMTPCCTHCGCPPDQRTGHDDTCSHGCNDTDASIDLYGAPEGTIIYKPEKNGWMLFIRDAGWWRCIDAYDRNQRGTRYTPAAVGEFSPTYVVWTTPEIGYYTGPEPAEPDQVAES